ncbi:MAG: TIR domain-containing protein [Dehalococcoidia bacterium]
MSMSLEARAKAAIDSIHGLLAELASLIKKVHSDDDYELGRRRLDRWESKTILILKAQVGDKEAENFNRDTPMGWASFDLVENLASQAKIYHAYLTTLKEELESSPEYILIREDEAEEHDVLLNTEVNPRCVFLVHGRDEANLLKLRDLVKGRWNLEPKILQKEGWGGRTLIEKFEEEAKEAAFAVVLITPDDTIKSVHGEYVQGRPNVIFELGWFYGKLGRKNVTILLKKGTQLHSDLNGIGRVDFIDSVEEAVIPLEEELKKGGMI